MGGIIFIISLIIAFLLGSSYGRVKERLKTKIFVEFKKEELSKMDCQSDRFVLGFNAGMEWTVNEMFGSKVEWKNGVVDEN